MTDDDMVFIEGLWVPAGDVQLIEGLQATVKAHKRPIIDGRVAWRYDRIEAALEFIPLNRRRVCIDIGAHIGLWTRWLAKSFFRTHAFEPIQRHLDCLNKNLFPDYGKIEVHPIALNDGLGKLIVMTPELEVSGRSHVKTEAEDETFLNGKFKHPTILDFEISEVRPLDMFKFLDVDLIKIDVEGYETHVLEGARETIKENRPVIVIEQLGHEEKYGETRDSALALLKCWGMVELRSNMKGDYYMGWPR